MKVLTLPNNCQLLTLDVERVYSNVYISHQGVASGQGRNGKLSHI